MKKIFYILLLVLMLSLVACNTDSGDDTEHVPPSAPPTEETPDVSDAKFNDAYFIYDGNTHSIYVENLPSDVMVFYTGNDVKEIGEYTVTATVYDFSGNLLLTLTAKIYISKEIPEVELPLV